MKILSWRVDGFGVFTGTQVNDIGPGLTIVHGRNESGKTTLVDFLCGVLFGYPDRRRRVARHEPLAGGRHGGSVELLGDDGSRMRVERHVGAREAVITVDGEPRSAADLRRLLGGADEGLFRSTFAFGLDELRSLETLEQDEVRDLIYSAGVLGAGQRATAVLRALDERRARIVRARRPDARANHLAEQLDDVEQVLREARRRARHFPEMQAELDRRHDAVLELAGRLNELTARRREIDRLLAAWPVWNRGRLATEQLDVLAAAADNEEDAAILACGPEVSELAAKIRAEEARADQRASLDRSRASLSETVARELAQLGKRWDLHRVIETDCSIGALAAVRAHEAALDDAAAAVKVQAERVQLAQEAHARAAAARDVTRHTRPLEMIERDRTHLKACRALLASVGRLDAEARAEALARRINDENLHATGRARHGRHGRRASVRSRGVAPALAYGAVVLFAVLAAAGVVMHETTIAIGAIVAMAIAAVAATRLRTVGEHPRSGDAAAAIAPTAAPSPSASSTVEEDFASTQARLAALVGDLGLSWPVVEAELDRLEEDLEAERDACAARQRATADLAQAIRLLESETASMRGRESALANAEAAWSEWKAAANLVDAGTPSNAQEVLGLVSTLVGHAEALARVEKELERHGAAAEELERAAQSLARRLGTGLGTGPHGAGLGQRAIVELLERLVRSAEERRERTAALQDAAASADRELTEMLGGSGCRLRQSIAAGEISAWEDEQAELQSQLAAAAAAYEAAVREHQDQARQLDAVAASDHIARVELDRTRLRADLHSELADWWVLSLARTIIASTLETYERDRQPAVVKRAAELFSEVTGGRYVRLVPRTANGSKSRSMDVVDEAGRTLDISGLSRGTVEQLYLCLRIALAAVFAEQSVALPFLMDDVLVNLDPERAQSMAGVLARISTRHQLLFFTCHPHTVEMLARSGAGVRIVELATRSSSGSPFLAPPLRPVPASGRSRPVA